MSVLILQGPRAAAPVIEGPTWTGHDLRTVRCRDIAALVSGLHAARSEGVALVVFDGGDLRRPEYQAGWAALRDALDALPVPYTELETDAAAELAPWLHPRHAPLATLITPSDRACAYAMSRAIAQRHLGRDSVH